MRMCWLLSFDVVCLGVCVFVWGLCALSGEYTLAYETCLKGMYFISKSCPFAVFISLVSCQNKQDLFVLLFKLCQLQFPSQYFCVIRFKSFLHGLSVNYTSRLYLFFQQLFFCSFQLQSFSTMQCCGKLWLPVQVVVLVAGKHAI